MNKTIVIIEDDLDLVEMLYQSLQGDYTLHRAGEGWDGIDLVTTVEPDLVLLDLLLPGIDGWEVCRRIRHEMDVPIIVLTALGHEQHIIRALDMGVDDYVTKPFHLGELAARIRAALRRDCRLIEGTTVEIDCRLKLDQGTRSVMVDGKWVELSLTEYDLLTLLIENSGRILTHETLLARVWGGEHVGQNNYLKVYIHRLRQKIEENPGHPAYILTERGIGYRFKVPAPGANSAAWGALGLSEPTR